jgi:hypothetical protein
MSIYDHFHNSSTEEPIISQTNNELESLIYHPFHNHPSSGSSTIQSPSHLLGNYNHQRQISSSITQQKFDQSISTKIQTGSNKN